MKISVLVSLAYIVPPALLPRPLSVSFRYVVYLFIFFCCKDAFNISRFVINIYFGLHIKHTQTHRQLSRHGHTQRHMQTLTETQIQTPVYTLTQRIYRVQGITQEKRFS